MSDATSTAQQLLGIYQARLKMAKEGTIHPRPEIIAGMKQLVSGLSKMASDAKVRLESDGQKTRFTAASTGSLLVEFDFKDDA